ncbi:MFS transporter [Granulosicoccaceae sp. 1_MG-2023]|nr:MFS transporter [Granulosicoccaceae sp. 1_MG-2023]
MKYKPDSAPAGSWRASLTAFLQARVIAMLFLGFSAGVPILLIFSSLGLWLREAGVDRSAVTFFSWAALGYSFKFVWAPLVDRLPLPWLSARFGRRRGWLLLAQLAIIGSLVLMAMTDPAAGRASLTLMALAAVLLGFSSATQDVVIDAYRIEAAPPELQALMSSTYIAGYRVGMLVAGAGALFLAGSLGSEAGAYSYAAWRTTYLVMGLVMLIGVLTTLLITEPDDHALRSHFDAAEHLRFLLLFAVSVLTFILVFAVTGRYLPLLREILAPLLLTGDALAGFLSEAVRLTVAATLAGLLARFAIQRHWVNQTLVRQSYVDPVRDFFARYPHGLAWLLLALVGLYRISDIVLGVISNVFYQDMGFSKEEIATVVKSFGLFMTLAGGFIGGLMCVRYGVMRILFLGALLSAVTNLLFMLLAGMGDNLPMLYLVISADNLSGGIASAAFIAFLSSLTNLSFTAMQYAIFSSLMSLLPKLIGGYSGSMVDNLGYPGFFLLTALMGLPILLLVLLAGRYLQTRSV